MLCEKLKNGILLLRQLFLIFNHCFFLLFSPLPRVNSLHMPVDTKKNEHMFEIVSVFFIHVDTIQEEKANFKEE